MSATSKNNAEPKPTELAAEAAAAGVSTNSGPTKPGSGGNPAAKPKDSGPSKPGGGGD